MRLVNKWQRIQRFFLIPLLDIVSSVLISTIIFIISLALLSPLIILIFLPFYILFYQLQKHCKISLYIYFLAVPLLASIILFVWSRLQMSLSYDNEDLHVISLFLFFTILQYLLAFMAQLFMWIYKAVASAIHRKIRN